MKGEAPVSPYTKVPGWETSAEQAVLKKYANRVPIGGSILEIGSEFGMSTSILRKFSFPNVVLLCVESNPEAPFVQNLTEVELNFRIFWHCVHSDRFFKDWPAWEGEEAGLKDKKFNLIFVDGDHHYAQAKRDIENAFNWLQPKGVVILHDVAVPTNLYPHEQHTEVLRAMTEVMDANKEIILVETADSMAVLTLR